MRRWSRGFALGLAGVAWWLASCRDLPAPEGGVFAISALQLPSPGLVAGDTMRDSTGMVAALRVIAFDVEGDTIPGAPTSFVVLDTGAHVTTDGLLIGDIAGRTVRIVGSLAALQTQPTPVKVTLSPDTLFAADSARHVRTYLAVTTDSVINSAALTVVAAHRDGTVFSSVDAVVVDFELIDAPPSADGRPTILLMGGSTPASRDTTESGRASIVARLRLRSFTITGPDSATLTATASYRGRIIGAVRFTVVFVPQ